MRGALEWMPITCVVRSIVGFVCFAAFTLGAEPNSEPKSFRILPMGDSITQGGQSFECYRYPLLVKLKAEGYHVKYVGSHKSDSPFGPLAHEGHGGKTAEFLASRSREVFQSHPAEVLLLHAGHNHFIEEHPIASIIKAHETIIQNYFEANPQGGVFVAQVIPAGKLPKYAYIPELNFAINQLAGALKVKHPRIWVVDQASGFKWGEDTVADKVHPNMKGAEKMAQTWFDAIKRSGWLAPESHKPN